MTTTAEVWFTPPREEDRYLPEGPRVLRTGEFAWVNIQDSPDVMAGSLHFRSRDLTQHDERTLFGRPGFILPADGSPRGFILGMGDSIGYGDADAIGALGVFARLPAADPRVIINDGEVVPGGKAIVFGTKDTKFEQAAALAHLYLYTVDDRRLSVLAGGMTCSNGKVFANGGRTLYDIDTPRKVVTEYELDIEKRTLTEKGIALDLRNEPASPDGMCDAGDGTVIIAFYNPVFAEYGRAVRYRLHTGEVLHEWHTPGSPRVTCPLLFEDNGKVKLLLTTATEGMPPDMRAKCPNAGCLFISDTDLKSVPPTEVVRV